MSTCFLLVFATLIFQPLVISATLDQFWPWAAPNTLVFGTPFATFSKARPSATQFSMAEHKQGKPFSGGMWETLPDGSKFIYGFSEDKLDGASWVAPATTDIGKTVRIIRSSLLRTCDEPIFGTTGRIKARGGLARIVWEHYRPKADKNYLITLKATSESGIEVDLLNESEAVKRGIKTTPLTYEEVEQAVGSMVESEGRASTFIDLLADARAEEQQPKKAESETSSPKAIETPPQAPPAVSPKPTLPVEPAPELTELPSTLWIWWLGGLALAALAFIANELRKRRR